jgi:uncharacterized protein (DUF1330 family)
MHLAPDLLSLYGLNASPDGSVPGLAEMGEGPVTVVNHFALRHMADYDNPAIEASTGIEAMLRYAAVSRERVEAVGGRLVVQGLGAHALWGDDDRWDVLVVANYPSVAALVALLQDEEYQRAFVHRRAAIARQRVTVSATLP